jgi:EAL domain-containing protein (putative c-di-GMP-specific phosphodiesterase class I)
MDKTLIDKLKFYIDKYDIDPTHINLEITETATNFDENRLKEQLVNIKKLGFTFSLDDYGTGYSNLVRVLEYPVDIIKLDKSIVWSAFSDNDSFVTLKNIVSMFHDVRRKLVAEGVESEEQMQALKELGCDYIQGYFYSKPVPKNDFWEYVKKVNSI